MIGFGSLKKKWFLNEGKCCLLIWAAVRPSKHLAEEYIKENGDKLLTLDQYNQLVDNIEILKELDSAPSNVDADIINLYDYFKLNPDKEKEVNERLKVTNIISGNIKHNDQEYKYEFHSWLPRSNYGKDYRVWPYRKFTITKESNKPAK